MSDNGMKTRISDNVGRLLVAFYAVRQANSPLPPGWWTINRQKAVDEALAIETAVTEATRQKPKLPFPVGECEADVQPEAHGVAEDE